MAIEEVGHDCSQKDPKLMVEQEFGIEIPDKDADAIHSGEPPRGCLLHRD
jgi:hypothetical protein